MDHDKGFRKIVLATDGSPEAESAVDETIGLARFTPATVRVLHIWNLEVHHRRGFWDVELRAQAEQLVQATADRLIKAGVMAETEVYHADNSYVPQAIAEVTREWGADLVVIGSRGLSDWQSLTRHSVSHKVLAEVACPVLVVRSRGQHGSVAPARKILLAVAGGDDVGPAVRAAIAAAQTAGAAVMVLHVAQTMFWPQGFAYVEGGEEIEKTVESALSMLGRAGIPAESMVIRTGPAAPAIRGLATHRNAYPL